MEKPIPVFAQQYLLQTTADLLNRRAEIQKLRAAIQLAEASRQCLTGPKVINIGKPDFTAFDR
jgi:hypothetical protein